MTPKANARLAGVTFLLYIAAGITILVLFSRATGGAADAGAKLAGIAAHATLVRLTVVLTMLTFLCAVLLGVTLYALTRDEDRDLAMIALCCRVSEGLIGAASASRTLGLVSIATAATAATADAAGARAFGTFLLQQGGWSTTISATCFAFGSTIFAYLFLRARTIPVPLAWLGVVASALLVVVLPLQLAGLLRGLVTDLVWIPMAAFEVALALWLIFKGVALRP